MKVIDEVLFLTVAIGSSLIICTLVHELIHIVLILLLEPKVRIVSIHLFDKYCLSKGTLGKVIVKGEFMLPVIIHELIAYIATIVILFLYLSVLIVIWR